jgi:hypothetical protein
MVVDPRVARMFRMQENESETQAAVRRCLGRTKLSNQEPRPNTEPANDVRAQRRQDLQSCINWLLQVNSPSQLSVEKRSHRRFPFRRPITITPVSNATGRPDQFKSFPAFGIDISSTGICFLARQLVPVRKAVLSLEGPGDKTVALLFEPRWVRFTRGSWYQTGGRLLEVLSEDGDVMPVMRFMEPPTELLDLCENSRHP